MAAMAAALGHQEQQQQQQQQQGGAPRSTWMARLQAAQRAEQTAKKLDDDVRARLLRGADVKTLWRQIRGALGEEECQRVARQGWELQRQAVELPPSSMVGPQPPADHVQKQNAGALHETAHLPAGPSTASATFLRTQTEIDGEDALAGRRGASSSCAFSPSEFDLDISDVNGSSFLFQNQQSSEFEAHYSPPQSMVWAETAASTEGEPFERQSQAHPHYQPDLHEATMQAAAASRLKRGLSSMYPEVGGPQPSHMAHGGSASSASTTSWGGASPGFSAAYGQSQPKRRYMS